MKKKTTFCSSEAELLKDDKAATAVEFALVFPIFFFFLMGFIEFALIMFGNAVLESVITRASRRAMVGCIERECLSAPQTVKVIKNEIRKNSIGFIDPDDADRFRIAVQPVTGVGYYNKPETEIIWGTIDLGQSGEVVAYSVEYKWNLFLPLPENVIGFHAGFFTFAFGTVVRNEQFVESVGGRRLVL